MRGTGAPDRPSWTAVVLSSMGVVAIGWTLWSTSTLAERLVRDTLMYLFIPFLLAAIYREKIGWTVDRDAIRMTVLLTLLVLPFYVVGSTFPAVRNAYPMWETGLSLSEFLPHVVGLLAITVAVETYYRGFLCIGLRRLGPVCVFVHIPLYVYVHWSNPPIEVILSAFAGLLFGYVAYKTNSIVPTVTAHFIGLVVLDILVLQPPLFALHA